MQLRGQPRRRRGEENGNGWASTETAECPARSLAKVKAKAKARDGRAGACARTAQQDSTGCGPFGDAPLNCCSTDDPSKDAKLTRCYGSVVFALCSSATWSAHKEDTYRLRTRIIAGSLDKTSTGTCGGRTVIIDQTGVTPKRGMLTRG
jgi:hypothetical protein